jgi:SAM-dependent methyltransferase
MMGLPDKFYGQDLAELHNLHYAEYVNNAGPGVLAVLRQAGISRGAVLDLGCGGGQLSQRLLGEGYSPVGVDVSAAMIRLARKRVPAARFIRGSISSVRLPRCAAAVAIGEVFNYLPSPKAMDRALRNAFQALAPGGVLVFDVKEPLPGLEKTVRTSARRGGDWAIFVEVEEDPSRRRLVRKIVTFRKQGGSYRRHDEVHRQVMYQALEVSSMLRTIGFSVRVAKGYGKFRLSPDRKVLIARKPPNIRR